MIVGGDQFDVDIRYVTHAHDGVVVEVRLHDRAVPDADFLAQGEPEPVDDAALALSDELARRGLLQHLRLYMRGDRWDVGQGDDFAVAQRRPELACTTRLGSVVNSARGTFQCFAAFADKNAAHLRPENAPGPNQNGANGTSFGPAGRSYGAFHVVDTGASDWLSCFARANAGELATSARPTNIDTAAFFILHSFAQVFARFLTVEIWPAAK
jgi:hypothetical protein